MRKKFVLGLLILLVILMGIKFVFFEGNVGGIFFFLIIVLNNEFIVFLGDIFVILFLIKNMGNMMIINMIVYIMGFMIGF